MSADMNQPENLYGFKAINIYTGAMVEVTEATYNILPTTVDDAEYRNQRYCRCGAYPKS